MPKEGFSAVLRYLETGSAYSGNFVAHCFDSPKLKSSKTASLLDSTLFLTFKISFVVCRTHTKRSRRAVMKKIAYQTRIYTLPLNVYFVSFSTHIYLSFNQEWFSKSKKRLRIQGRTASFFSNTIIFWTHYRKREEVTGSERKFRIFMATVTNASLAVHMRRSVKAERASLQK